MTTVFIISAPSGSGKSTLVSHLLNSRAVAEFGMRVYIYRRDAETLRKTQRRAEIYLAASLGCLFVQVLRLARRGSRDIDLLRPRSRVFSSPGQQTRHAPERQLLSISASSALKPRVRWAGSTDSKSLFIPPVSS